MRRVIAAIGRSFITVGILVLLFVAYQLWGTGIYTAAAQNDLEREFQAQLDRRSASTTTTTTASIPPSTTAPTTPTTTPATTPTPALVDVPDIRDGDPMARLVIPKLGVDKIVIEGTKTSDLRRGPGHYGETPFPGQRGNAGIAGHRTTYGAPFGDLDLLEPGDVINVETVQGKFEYRVYSQRIVIPAAFEVLDPVDGRDAVLTLTTCHPKFSAAQRLIVQAELVQAPGEEPLPSSVDPTPVKTRTKLDDLSGEHQSKTPTVLTGLAAATVGAAWWLLFHRHRRWTNWLIGAVAFAPVLSLFYFNLERILPSNY